MRRGLADCRFGRPLHVYHSAGSTNDLAAELASGGAPEGALVLAEEQTAGRGRSGRGWDTPAGAGLAISVVLRPPSARASGLGLIGALGVVEGLAAYGLQAEVKWPNDVLLGGKKVAGVLPEASWDGAELEHLVLGIGLNLRPAPQLDRAAYEYPATTLEEAGAGDADPNRLIPDIIGGLERWYQRHLQGAAHPAWEQHLAYRAADVQWEQDGRRRHGIVQGLSPQGALRLRDLDGVSFELQSGQARIRPVRPGLA